MKQKISALGCRLMKISVNKRVATFVGTSRRRMLEPWEAASESESLCQAQFLVQWLPNFHLLAKRLFLMGILPNDANFWEAGQGPSAGPWHGMGGGEEVESGPGIGRKA